MKTSPVLTGDKLMLLCPKGQSPDFKAAQKALNALISKDWRKVQAIEAKSRGHWQHASSAKELKDAADEEFTEYSEALKSSDHDPFYYLKLSLPKNDAWILYTTFGVGDNLPADVLCFMQTILQFDDVSKVIDAIVTEV